MGEMAKTNLLQGDETIEQNEHNKNEKKNIAEVRQTGQVEESLPRPDGPDRRENEVDAQRKGMLWDESRRDPSE